MRLYAVQVWTILERRRYNDTDALVEILKPIQNFKP